MPVNLDIREERLLRKSPSSSSLWSEEYLKNLEKLRTADKNGKFMIPVKGATLIGEAKEVMPRISMCANDLDLAAGFCGSVSGYIYVTVGQPHIKVDSITVGGR